MQSLIGKRIHDIRESRNITQEYLAEKVQVSPTSISRHENGHLKEAGNSLMKFPASSLYHTLLIQYSFTFCFTAFILLRPMISSSFVSITTILPSTF